MGHPGILFLPRWAAGPWAIRMTMVLRSLFFPENGGGVQLLVRGVPSLHRQVVDAGGQFESVGVASIQEGDESDEGAVHIESQLLRRNGFAGDYLNRQWA